uniref:Integrase, catalytic region, zinc finger, CCHC-type, peptidase aspartic, catalytic n=1 Tax=Tanacetum cinerariifolium TaxID=118510 RepID=A0A6L2NLZ8_TANCI|nr:integrase, catalytic region, zinc finger, CCHC-type, peptidase aspartic, catalytic [Tanacetum cinerariifolium]
MTRNRRLFTSYKEYDGGHVVFGSNLKGKVIGRGNISHDSITIKNVDHDTEKKQLGKKEAKMTIYNALPCKEYECVFMCKTAKEI